MLVMARMQRRRSRWTGASLGASLVACLAACLLLAPAGASAAAPGQLRSSFGTQGRLWSFGGLTHSWGLANAWSAVTPKGAFYVAARREDAGPLDYGSEDAEARISRFRQNGTPAPGFGAGGTETVPVPGLAFSISDLLVDPQGRAIAVGTGFEPPTPVPPTPPFLLGKAYSSYATVVRLRPDGSPDPSFGGGDGVALNNFGLSFKEPFERPAVRGSEAAIDSRGRIVLVVSQEEVGNSGSASPGLTISDKLVARLTPEGALDTSFGDGGVVPLEEERWVDGIAIGPDDEITLATSGEEGGSRLRRLTAAGRPDPAFGDDGVVPWGGSSFSALSFDRQGRLLVLGWRTGRTRSAGPVDVVKRVLPSGATDPSFGRHGALRFDLGGPSSLNGISADSGGGLYLTGTFFQRRYRRQPWREAHRKLIVLHRLASGRADRAFGRRGHVVTGFGKRNDAGAFTSATTPRHGLLVTGFASSRQNRGGYRPSTLVLAKYRAAGR